MESWYVLRATKPGVRVRDLCRQYKIETLREYRQRSRQQINQRRKEGEDGLNPFGIFPSPALRERGRGWTAENLVRIADVVQSGFVPSFSLAQAFTPRCYTQVRGSVRASGPNNCQQVAKSCMR